MAKKIVEQTLDVKNPLVKNLLIQAGWAEDDPVFEKDDCIAHVVYFNGKKPQWIFGVMGQFSTDVSPGELNFTELMNTIKKPNFGDYLLLTSYYKDFSLDNKKLRKIITSKSPFKKDEMVDSILSISKGYLAYGYQYELLAQAVFGLDVEKARRLRKDYNMKLHGIYDSFQKADRIFFKKMLAERIITSDNLITTANWVGAKNLLEWSLLNLK
jgi:hypothetical protein